MFLMQTKVAAVKALQAVFADEYPIVDFRNLHISIEYPIDKQDVPALWVDFEPSSSSIQTVGINHVEYHINTEGNFVPIQRWSFSGYISTTVVAFSSAVRDMLTDEMISVFAFGRTDPKSVPLIAAIENNPYIALNLDWDQVTLSQMAMSPMTPWGTDEPMYEATVRIQCMGEFVSDPKSGELLPVREVRIYPRAEGEPDTTTSGGWV